MSGTSRLGTNPLEWIKDSRDDQEENQKSKHSLPSKHSKQNKPFKSSKIGLKDGWTRATFIVRESVLEKAKDLAYWERKKIQEVIDDALGSHISNKKIKPRPKREDH
jgi:hypothetical protein